MKIGLLGQFGSGNSGNDGSLEAMATILGSVAPHAEILCICNNPAVVMANLGIAAIGLGAREPSPGPMAMLDRLALGLPHRLASLVDAFRRTRGLDWLIVPGTGILDDYRDRPFGWPYVLLRWCLAARLNGARIALVSVGAGPIVHPLSRLFLTGVARMARYRSYRDDLSRDFMAGCGLDVTQDRVHCDIAFGLPALAARGKADHEGIVVGVGMMRYYGWRKYDRREPEIYRAYLAKMAAFVAYLLQRGCRVRLLTGDADDLCAVDDVRRELAQAGIAPAKADLGVGSARSLAGLARQMAGVDVVVASRYHNIVCALSLGLPVISLSYAAKNDALLERCGLGGFSQPVETFSVPVLAEQLERVLAERDSLGQAVREGVAKLRAEAAAQKRALAVLLPAGRSEPERPRTPRSSPA